MKKTLLLIVLTLFTVTGFAQKVKFKKGSVLIDEVETYKMKESGSTDVFSTLSGKEFLVISAMSYREEDDIAINVTPKHVYILRFLKSGKIVYTDASQKAMIANVYNDQMVDADGNVDEKKLDEFIFKYNNASLKNKL
ncbi:MAG: hypothetical protein EOO48_02455 [Flavobacterium sp.]|nr:MAG: hypothetical protein EOO48_02455 [Flavobacterium sp.]